MTAANATAGQVVSLRDHMLGPWRDAQRGGGAGGAGGAGGGGGMTLTTGAAGMELDLHPMAENSLSRYVEESNPFYVD